MAKRTDGYVEVAPHIMEHVQTKARYLSAEKTREILRENLRRLKEKAR